MQKKKKKRGSPPHCSSTHWPEITSYKLLLWISPIKAPPHQIGFRGKAQRWERREVKRLIELIQNWIIFFNHTHTPLGYIQIWSCVNWIRDVYAAWEKFSLIIVLLLWAPSRAGKGLCVWRTIHLCVCVCERDYVQNGDSRLCQWIRIHKVSLSEAVAHNKTRAALTRRQWELNTITGYTFRTGRRIMMPYAGKGYCAKWITSFASTHVYLTHTYTHKHLQKVPLNKRNLLQNVLWSFYSESQIKPMHLSKTKCRLWPNKKKSCTCWVCFKTDSSFYAERDFILKVNAKR